MGILDDTVNAAALNLGARIFSGPGHVTIEGLGPPVECADLADAALRLVKLAPTTAADRAPITIDDATYGDG